MHTTAKTRKIKDLVTWLAVSDNHLLHFFLFTRYSPHSSWTYGAIEDFSSVFVELYETWKQSGQYGELKIFLDKMRTNTK